MPQSSMMTLVHFNTFPLASRVAISPVLALSILLAGCSSSEEVRSAVQPPQKRESYGTDFPFTENPISEGQNWVNGDTVGLDWSNVQTNSGLAFGTQSGLEGYDDSTAILAGVWNADQSIQARVHTVNQKAGNIFEEVELRLRTTIAPHSITGYEINFRCTTDGSQYVQIVRWNGPFGKFTYVRATTGPGIRDGDLVKASISGNTITVHINSVQVLQGSDVTFKKGNPGIGFFLQGVSGLNGDFGLTNISATAALAAY